MPFPVLQARALGPYGSADSGMQLVLRWQLTSETQKQGPALDEVEPKRLARSTLLVETGRPVDTPGDMMRKSKSARNRLHVETQDITGSGHLQRSPANAAELQASIRETDAGALVADAAPPALRPQRSASLRGESFEPLAAAAARGRL
jgi:hypothetical protein